MGLPSRRGVARSQLLKSVCLDRCDPWQAATGTPDLNSVSGAPAWVSEGTDYHLTSSDNGEAGLGVTNDFDGVTRANPGDRGCYEYVSVSETTRAGTRQQAVGVGCLL